MSDPIPASNLSCLQCGARSALEDRVKSLDNELVLAERRLVTWRAIANDRGAEIRAMKEGHGEEIGESTQTGRESPPAADQPAVRYCRTCRWAQANQGELECSHEAVAGQDPHSLASMSAYGPACFTERGGGPRNRCGKFGRLWEAKTDE